MDRAFQLQLCQSALAQFANGHDHTLIFVEAATAHGLPTCLQDARFACEPNLSVAKETLAMLTTGFAYKCPHCGVSNVYTEKELVFERS